MSTVEWPSQAAVMVLESQLVGVGLKFGLMILRRVCAISPRAVRAGSDFEALTHAPTKPADPTATNRRREKCLFFNYCVPVTMVKTNG
jgi:hypothetical protein